jgi:hypothetical protein
LNVWISLPPTRAGVPSAPTSPLVTSVACMFVPDATAGSALNVTPCAANWFDNTAPSASPLKFSTVGTAAMTDAPLCPVTADSSSFAAGSCADAVPRTAGANTAADANAGANAKNETPNENDAMRIPASSREMSYSSAR